MQRIPWSNLQAWNQLMNTSESESPSVAHLPWSPVAGAWLEHCTGDRCPIGPTASLGRNPSNQVVLSGEKVSRRHAVVQKHGETDYWLSDASSTNGTLLNGIRLQRSARLYDQDQIVIGPHRLTFRNPAGPRRAQTLQLPAGIELHQEAHVTQCGWLLLVRLDSPSRVENALGSESEPATLGDWCDETLSLVEDQGGNTGRYLADGWVSWWLDHEETRLNVVQALVALHERQQSRHPPFRFCLHYGHIHVPNRINEQLGGTALNQLYRIDKLGESIHSESILCEAAHALLHPLLTLKLIGCHRLTGFSSEQHFYRM